MLKSNVIVSSDKSDWFCGNISIVELITNPQADQ